MLRHMKKWWLLYSVIIFILYLIIGAVIPFMHYKRISTETKEAFQANEIFENYHTDRAMLVETNLSAWEERLRLLNMAKDRIVLSTFDIREGKSTEDIAALLLHKAEEGVKVYILVDGLNGFLNIQGSEFFYALSSHPNIQIKLYNPINLLTPWKSQGRMHDKYVMVDDIAYILGGRNTFDYFIGNYKSKSKSYDREVLVYNTLHGTAASKDSSIAQLDKYFRDIWDYKECVYFKDDESLGNRKNVIAKKNELMDHYQNLQTRYPELFEDFDYISHTYVTEGINLISNPTDIYAKEPVVFYQLTELMMNAKNRVIIQTPYAVFNQDMYDMMKNVNQTVPDCRMILNSVENGDNFFASSDYLRNKGDLLKTGLTLYEFDGGISYHAKSIAIDDDISIIGSYNFDLRSTYMDTELMLVIKSTGLTQELVHYMEQLEHNCRLVVSETEYIVPEHIVVDTIPVWKRTALKFVGLIMQKLRFLL